MEPTTAQEMHGWTARSIVTLGAIVGLASGMMMAGVEMIYGWISDSHRFWDAPMAIWAWVAGLEHFGQPGNHVWPIILGIGGHMMNSTIAGIIFVALLVAARSRGVIAPVMAGIVYGLLLWVVMRYGILPLRDSTKVLFTHSLVSPQWVWWVAHAALGMTAGLVYAVAGQGLAGGLPTKMRRRERFRHAPA